MPITVGLRFDRRDAPVIKMWADRWRSEGGDGENIALFTRAAEDAQKGEPLRVICADPSEAKIMAALFTRLGTRPPAIEPLPTT